MFASTKTGGILVASTGTTVSTGYCSTHCACKPPLLYKYMQSKYADALCAEGKLRVSNLQYYRSWPQGKNDGRSDFGEGQATAFLNGSFVDRGSVKTSRGTRPTNDVEQSMLASFGVSNCKNIQIKDCFIDCIPSNEFIFCVSSRLDKTIAREFQSDACVKIIHPIRFGNLLTNQLRSMGLLTWTHCRLGPCQYTNRPLVIGDEPAREPLLTKCTNFKSQAEWRYLWRSNGHCSESCSVDITVPDLTKLVRRVW